MHLTMVSILSIILISSSVSLAQELARSTGNACSAAPKPSTSPTTTCAPAVLALSSGIALNIADQSSELTAVGEVSAILISTPFNSQSFSTASASLLSFVQKGISIRENNQKIAPSGNPAIPGLAIVANAQATELNLTLGLTGSNVTGDIQSVQMLQADFKGGIMQNQKNLMAATGNCAVSGKT